MIRKLRRKRDAVSSIVGWFLILILLATVTVVILLGSQQAVTERKNESRTGAVGKAFEEFDKNINDLLPSSPTYGKTEISFDSGYIDVDPKGSRIAVMYSFDPGFGFDVEGLDSFDLEDGIDDIKDSVTVKIGGVALNDDDTEFTKLETEIGDFVSGVLIQLFSDDYPPDSDPASGQVTFGSIWIFDLGRITYGTSGFDGEELESFKGGELQKVVYENCAVIRSTSESSYVQYSSNIENEGNDVVQLSVGLIRGDDITVSGSGIYELKFEVLNNYVRNKVETEVYNFKIKISGDYTESWYTYLTNSIKSYTFDQIGDYLLFNSGEKTDLVFSTFVVKINDINIK